MVKSVIIPTAFSTLGDILADGISDKGRMSLTCTACKSWHDFTHVEIAGLIRKHNPLWSPWNRRPPCPTCGKARLFLIGGSPMRPMTTADPNETRDLHFAHWRERNRRLGMGDIR